MSILHVPTTVVFCHHLKMESKIPLSGTSSLVGFEILEKNLQDQVQYFTGIHDYVII